MSEMSGDSHYLPTPLKDRRDNSHENVNWLKPWKCKLALLDRNYKFNSNIISTVVLFVLCSSYL